QVPEVRQAAADFPRQSTGFLYRDGSLYQVVITPVYVDSGLLNVLLAAYRVDEQLVARLREATGGSEFVFTAGNRIVASSLLAGAVQSCTASLLKNPQTASTRR